MPMPQSTKGRSYSTVSSNGLRISLNPVHGGDGEHLWKPTVAGAEYTTTPYGILKLLIIGMGVAGFICLLITTGGKIESGRYSCYLASTSLTVLLNVFIFAMSRFRVWDPRKPSLPHQIERLNGFVFVLWNFVSSGMVAPRHQSSVQAATSDDALHCRHTAPEEICRGSTATAAAIGFVLSATILVNFFLAVWWGPPLRYSLRLKNLTQGDKYENFSNDLPDLDSQSIASHSQHP